MLTTRLFSAALLLVAATAREPFLNKVRDAGLCIPEHEGITEDRFGDYSGFGGESVQPQADSNLYNIGEGLGDHLNQIPTGFGNTLERHSEDAAEYNGWDRRGPGSFTGTGCTVAAHEQLIPAVTVRTDVITKEDTKGATEADYHATDKSGQVYSLSGNLNKNTHSCGYTETDESADFSDCGYALTKGKHCGNKARIGEDGCYDDYAGDLAYLEAGLDDPWHGESLQITVDPTITIDERVYETIEESIDEVINKAVGFAIQEALKDAIKVGHRK